MKKKILLSFLFFAIVVITKAQCPKKVLAGNGSTSGNARAPITTFRYERSVYLIRASELTAAGYANGSIPTSIGWNYLTGSTGGSGPLVVYLQNTADVTNLKSTTWATAITGMTMVHNAVTTLPAGSGVFDITLTGGVPFTYTGGGIYVAFDWGNYTGTLGSSVILCTNVLANGLLGAQSNSAAPTTLAASAFRPETRLNGDPLPVSSTNDAAVSFVAALGELPRGLVPAQAIKAVITNNGLNTQTNLQVSLNVSGANTFTDMQTIPSLASCGGQTTVTFASYTPTVAGSDVITVSIPADDVAGNNSVSKTMNITPLDYSYKHPGSTASGGVGFTGATGAFVAKFTINGANAVTDVKLEFNAVTAVTYKVAIYGDNAGIPSIVPLYVDRCRTDTVTVA
jgi:hypothetical protein